MDKKILLALFGLTIVALAAAILLPSGRAPDVKPKLPWDIQLDASGNSRVFGLTLGESTLGEARQVFEVQDKLSLFVSPEGDRDFESYFQRVYLSGIRADIIIKLVVDDKTSTEMYERGSRISQLGGGIKKVNLSKPDEARLGSAAIGLITYLPGADLEPALITRRFGEPVRRITEPNGVEHWLYPDRGIDIAVNADGKEVIHYIPPSMFQALVIDALDMVTE